MSEQIEQEPALSAEDAQAFLDEAFTLGLAVEHNIQRLSSNPRIAVFGVMMGFLALSYKGRKEGLTWEDCMRGNYEIMDRTAKLIGGALIEADKEVMAEMAAAAAAE
jgi:hypothetical protein